MNLYHRHRLTKSAIVLLVLLRVGIGWHFAFEGFAKIRGPATFTAEGYLRQATGPLNELYARIVESPLLLDITNITMSWGMLVLGVLFMLGFLTRFSGVLLMLMLAAFYLAHPPITGVRLPVEEGNYLYVNRNLLEFLMIALLLATNVSRHSGLDMLMRRPEPAPYPPDETAGRQTDA